jgi:hypothetical protein
MFRLADAIEKRVKAATKRAEKLAQAIFAKAFQGELAPLRRNSPAVKDGTTSRHQCS